MIFEKEPLMDSSDEDDVMGGHEEMLRCLDEEELKQLEIDPQLPDDQYVLAFKDKVVDIFNKERGRDETKRANLSDMKSTRIDVPMILQIPLLSPEELSHVNRTQTIIYANVKALIPLMREKLIVEEDE